MIEVKKALFVGAHPDDIEMGAGATISKMIGAGIEVYAAVMTGKDEDVRRWESSYALKELGVREDKMVFYGFEDTNLCNQLQGMVRAVDSMVKRGGFDLVVSHYHADTHQDHVAVYQAVAAGARMVPNMMMFRPTYPSGRPDIPFHPTYVSRVSDKDMARKEKAMRKFVSQESKYGHGRWMESLRASAAGDSWSYGGEHGFAELFQISRFVG